MEKPRIGFIGLGIMGRPMCANLLKAGYSLTVWNRSQPGIDEVVGYGAEAGATPADVAAKSDVIITIVTDSLPALAGHNLGPTAPELLLSALASCLAHTYLVVAINHGVRYETLEVEVRGCIDYRGLLEVDPAAPIAPYDLAYDAQIATDATDAMLARVQADVERLCPVLRALTQPTPVTGRVVRTGAAVAAG